MKVELSFRNVINSTLMFPSTLLTNPTVYADIYMLYMKNSSESNQLFFSQNFRFSNV